MHRFNSALILIPAFVVLISAAVFGKSQSGSETANKTPQLEGILAKAVQSTLDEFQTNGLKPEELTAAVIDLNDVSAPVYASYRGEEQVYAASVVKMFYMAYYFRLFEDGKLKPTPEVERGVRDMIVDSGNEATGYILDVLTGTTSGPEIPAKQFAKWSWKRDAVNRYFKKLGYTNINVNQKTHCEDAYGIEQQFRNYKGENRNMLTANASARLMKEIVLGEAVNKQRSLEMMSLMSRDWEKPAKSGFDQEFISHALEPGTKLWSKEGWTSKTRHDVAYIETPQGLKLVIAVFTENHASEKDIIPAIARRVIKGLGEKAE